MFKKNERLSRSEFDIYFKSGKRFNFKDLTIIYSPLEELKVGVVVGKKVSKSAVRRNTLRRRVFARLRTELKAVNKTGVFIVLTKNTFNSLTRKTADDNVTESIAQVIKST